VVERTECQSEGGDGEECGDEEVENLLVPSTMSSAIGWSVIMKSLLIQVQPQRVSALPVERVIAAFTAISSMPEVVEHRFDHGDDYLNFWFGASDVANLWRHIRSRVFAEFGHCLESSSIVICKGESGWDDYHLLYHFDETIPRDAL
jgi:hypothetical protein